MRRIVRTRKIGHAGTLDPMATGVLVLGVERATQLLGHLTLTAKTYVATIRLGYATVTDDSEGERGPPAPVRAAGAGTHLDADRVRAEMAALTGTIDQVPAAVSAVKVAGRRAYRPGALRRGGRTGGPPGHRLRFELLADHRPEPDLLDLDVDRRLLLGHVRPGAGP